MSAGVFGRRRRARLSWLIAIAAFGLVAVAYAPRLVTGFVADDFPVIVYLAKTPWADLLVDDFWGVEGGAGRYRPVLHLSAKLDVALFGTWFYGFHLVNVLLHWATGLLLGRLIVDVALPWTPRAPFIGVVCAGLWLLHPVNAEVVGWFAARGNILGLFFAVLALLIWQRRRGALSVALAFAAALLAHFSHEMVFLLPFVAVAIAWAAGRRRRWSAVNEAFTVFAAALGLSALVRVFVVDEPFGGELTELLGDVPRGEWPRLLWAAFRARVEILLVPVHSIFIAPWLWWLFAVAQLTVLVLGGLQIRRAPFLAMCAVGFAFVAPSALTIIDAANFANSRQLYAAAVPYCVLVATALSVLRRRPRIVLALIIVSGYGVSTLGVNFLRASAAADVAVWRAAAYQAAREHPSATRLELLEPPLVRDGMLVLENATPSFFVAPWYTKREEGGTPQVHPVSREYLFSNANPALERRGAWLASGVLILRRKPDGFASHLLPRAPLAAEFEITGPRASKLSFDAWAVPAVRIEGDAAVRLLWRARDGRRGTVLPCLIPQASGGGLLFPLTSDLDCLLAGELRELEFVGGAVRRGASMSRLPELQVSSPLDVVELAATTAAPRFVASPWLYDPTALAAQGVQALATLRFVTVPAAVTVPALPKLVDGKYVFAPTRQLQVGGGFSWDFFVHKLVLDPRVQHVAWCFEERDVLGRVVARSRLRRLLPKR